jgi:prephenate dehydrogenase
MKKIITVIGMGLIGGSICKSLQGKHDVFGIDLSEEILKDALNCGYIQGIGYLKMADIVIVATPPKTVLETLKHSISQMKKNSIIIDVCGVKELFSKEINSFLENNNRENITYIGCHPMAGKENFGYNHSDARLFKGRDFIMTVEERMDKTAVEAVRQLARDMGFGRITECSPEHHDKVIAYTSQLAHIVSSCYVKSPTLPFVDGYCGGSFQDMTRVATLDREMWADLFLMNRENIIDETENLVKSLTNFLETLKSADKMQLVNEFADISTN